MRQDVCAGTPGHDITVSMSRPGNPYDNAKAESFMKTLKTEEVDGRSFKDLKDARRSIRVFIDTEITVSHSWGAVQCT